MVPKSRSHASRFERDRNRACISRLLAVPRGCFAVPCALPPIFTRPLDPAALRPHPLSRARRIWIGPDNIAGWNHPVSTAVIYAAAFHIFHCFQVFGSICKIKFVMRPTPRRNPPSPRSPPPPPAFLRAHQSRRIWQTGQSPSSALTAIVASDRVIFWIP